MRITRITPFVMAAGAPQETSWSAGGPKGGMSAAASRHWCFVRVETDAGITGIGEGSGWSRLVAAGIEDLAHIVMGEDPRDIDRLWHRMFVGQMGHGFTGTIGGGAIGAIDMALWDIKAKAMGVPLWQALGGRFRDRIRAYVHASTADSAKIAVAEGYGAIKTGNVRTMIEKVASLRAALGPEIDIAIDMHGPPWLVAADAIRVAKALEPFDPLFIEEPVAPEDVEGLARVRATTEVPIAAGERLAFLWGFKRLIGEGLVDIVQPDTGRVGGLTQLRKIAAFAEAHFVQVAPHSGTLGPIAEFAAIHFLATIPNGMIHERFRQDWEGRERILTHRLEVIDGHVIVPDRPGLGVDIIDAEVLKHPAGINVAQPSTKFHAAYEDGTGLESLYVQPRRRRAAFFAPARHDDAD